MKVDPQPRRQLTKCLYTHDINQLIQAYLQTGKYKRTVMQFKNEAGIVADNQDNEFNQAKLFVQLLNKGLYYSVFQKYLLSIDQQKNIVPLDKQLQCQIARYNLIINREDKALTFHVQQNHVIILTDKRQVHIYHICQNQIEQTAVLTDVLQIECVPARNDAIVLAEKSPIKHQNPATHIPTGAQTVNYLYVFNVKEQCISTIMQTQEREFNVLGNEILLENMYIDSIYLKHSDYITRPLPGNGIIITGPPSNTNTPYPKTNQQLYVIKYEGFVAHIMTTDQSWKGHIDIKYIQNKQQLNVSEIAKVFYPKNNLILIQDQALNVYKFNLVACYETNQHFLTLEYILPFNKLVTKISVNEQNYIMVDSIIYSMHGQAIMDLGEISDAMAYKDAFVILYKDGQLEYISSQALTNQNNTAKGSRRKVQIQSVGQLCIEEKDVYILTESHEIIHVQDFIKNTK